MQIQSIDYRDDVIQKVPSYNIMFSTGTLSYRRFPGLNLNALLAKGVSEMAPPNIPPRSTYNHIRLACRDILKTLLYIQPYKIRLQVCLVSPKSSVQPYKDPHTGKCVPIQWVCYSIT